MTLALWGLSVARVRVDGGHRHFIWAFVLALAGYALFYTTIEHRRTRKGPWEITFRTREGAPELIINQPALAITNVGLRFPEQPGLTNSEVRLTFGEARAVPFEVPFGKCVFLDTTFLPGTVTLQLCGHELELLPRVLILDHEEHPWRSGEVVRVGAGTKSKTE